MASPIQHEYKEHLKNLDVPAFLERPDVQAFVGRNFDKFKAKWLKDYHKRNDPRRMMRAHWNPLAFFLWFAWLAYRKMWRMLIGISAFIMAMLVAEAWYESTTGNLIPDSVFTGAQVALGMMATSYYFYHITHYFYKNPNPSADDLKRDGGPCVPCAIIGSLVYMAVMFATVYATIIVFPTPDTASALATINAVEGM